MDHIEAARDYRKPVSKIRVANGGWRETSLAIGREEQDLAAGGTQWSGRCETCFQVKPAGSLVLKTLPFGRGEVWVCIRGAGCGDPE